MSGEKRRKGEVKRERDESGKEKEKEIVTYKESNSDRNNRGNKEKKMKQFQNRQTKPKQERI